MSTKKKNSYAGIILFIFAFVAIVAFFIFIGFADYSKGRIPTEATTVKVIYHSKTKWYATYTVNGQTYKSYINGDTSNLHNGKRITVYYNPDNPNEIWHNPDRGRSITGISLIIGFIGLVAVLIIISSISSKKKQKKLEESGELQQYQNPYENNNETSNSSYNDINKF